jgi:hypothetical protein
VENGPKTPEHVKLAAHLSEPKVPLTVLEEWARVDHTGEQWPYCRCLAVAIRY